MAKMIICFRILERMFGKNELKSSTNISIEMPISSNKFALYMENLPFVNHFPAGFLHWFWASMLKGIERPYRFVKTYGIIIMFAGIVGTQSFFVWGGGVALP